MVGFSILFTTSHVRLGATMMVSFDTQRAPVLLSLIAAVDRKMKFVLPLRPYDYRQAVKVKPRCVEVKAARKLVENFVL